MNSVLVQGLAPAGRDKVSPHWLPTPLAVAQLLQGLAAQAGVELLRTWRDGEGADTNSRRGRKAARGSMTMFIQGGQQTATTRSSSVIATKTHAATRHARKRLALAVRGVTRTPRLASAASRITLEARRAKRRADTIATEPT